MHRRIGIVLGVALLVAGLAAPASASKGGHPGPPSGTDLEVTVETSSGFMWANSVGDQIGFDISVTNTSGGPLSGISVDFNGAPLTDTPFNLGKNESWTTPHMYTVTVADLDGPFMQLTDVNVGTVNAAIGSRVVDSDDAIMTAYPVRPCDQDGGLFVFTTDLSYEVCSFSGTGSWTLTTPVDKPPRGKRISPSATVRDGVPGNWCNVGEPSVDGNTVIDTLHLPTNGVCLGGGAGGDSITVRNHDLFYLATWEGNSVTATPGS